VPGVYPITVKHKDSILSTPDYGYVAELVWSESAEPDFHITIDDPDMLLGKHGESSYDYTIGKMAHLIIIPDLGHGCNRARELKLSKSVVANSSRDLNFCGYCSAFTTCGDCNDQSQCQWSKGFSVDYSS